MRLAKISLWMTPVFWMSSISVAIYGIYVSVAALLVAAIIGAVIARFRDDAPVISAALVFSALWWPLPGAAAGALCVVIGLLAPRRAWHFAAVAACATVALAVANPPVGPGHLGTLSGLVVVHALFVGAAVLVEVRGASLKCRL